MDISSSQDYMDSVMVTGNIIQVEVYKSNTGNHRSSEERKCSLADDEESESCYSKKQKGNNDIDISTRKPRLNTMSQGGDRYVTSNEDLLQALHTQTDYFNKRITMMEKRMCGNVKQMIDDEIKAVRCEMKELTQIRKEQADVRMRVDSTATKSASYADVVNTSANHLNFVLRNVIESAQKSVVSKANGMIRDGLKLEDIKVESAERKESWGSRYPGVIVARCWTMEDKRAILDNKKKLQNSKNFNKVYINSAKPLQQRILESNMRVIADTVGAGCQRMSGNMIQRVDRRRTGDDRKNWSSLPRDRRQRQYDSNQPSDIDDNNTPRVPVDKLHQLGPNTARSQRSQRGQEAKQH